MQTVSPNLAKQMRALCTVAVASGDSAKLRAVIMNVFVSENDLVRKAKGNGLGMDCQEPDAFGGRRDPTRLMTCLPVSVSTKQIPYIVPIRSFLLYLRSQSLQQGQPRICLSKMELSQQM